MKVADCDYLIGIFTSGDKQLSNSLEAVADFICEAGMEDDLVITKPDGQRVLNTFGIYIDRCADQEYLEKLLPVLIPKQMAIDGSDFEQECKKEEYIWTGLH
jgi:hypothetical protein